MDPKDYPMACSFLIITTNNLPEAYFVADFLLQKGQPVAIVNKRRRTRGESLRVVRRLARRRGPLYLADLLLGRLFRRIFISPEAVPFPEIDDARIREIIGRVPYHECDDPHAPQTIEWIENQAPDYILVAGSPVLGPAVFSLARHGTLNRHQGLSPGYRGSDCPVWVLAEGRPEDLGYTIHAVSEQVDGGPILRQERLSIPGGLDFSRALAYINRQASIGYTAVLDRIIEGHPLRPRPQNGSSGRHYPPATLSAIRRARNRYRNRAPAGREAQT